LRGATRAWAERFAEAVGRGAPHARTSLDNPDKDAIIASGDVFKRFGPYLQESGDVLLQVLRDSARATRHTDDALLAAATKGAGALPDTIVATIVVELLEGREDARRDVGENLDTTMMAALHAMAGAGKAGLTALIALTDALSPQAQFAVLDGRQQASGVANPRAFGYARDNGRADRDHERAAVIDALGAACRTRPNEAPGIAEALTRLAFDSTGDVPRGAQVGSKSQSPRYDTHIPSAYAARIAAIDALPSCGPAARGAVNGLIALANHGDIGASNGERELLAAAGRAAAAIQRSK
jgi:hypothetical protein